MSSAFSRLSAARIDGRTAAVRYRQDQLRKLHDVFMTNKTDLINAIVSDSEHSIAQAEIEFTLASSELKSHYLSLDLKKSLESEYSIARGRDAPNRRVGGVVYIVPTNYTQFYSVISPLSAAIAAGSCIILKLPNKLLTVNTLLRSWLRETLDEDAFAISEGKPDQDPELISDCVHVLQNDTEQASSAVRWVSPSNALSIGIVDRTADLGMAAAALVTARFSFGGKSCYAPDLVLVNEYAVKDFLNAVVRESTKYLAEQNGFADAGEECSGRAKEDPTDALEHLRRECGVRVIISGANGIVVEAKARNSALVARKIERPLLVIHAIRSLDDAINVASSCSDTLLSTLIFAGLPEAKYLSQFIPAHLSVINQIPVELLVGPAAPLNYPASISPRYSTDMFSTPRPQYLQPPNAYSKLLSTILEDHEVTSVDSKKLQELASLLPIDQRGGRVIGFFEQGLITGGLVVVTPVLGLLATAGYFGVRFAVRKLR